MKRVASLTLPAVKGGRTVLRFDDGSVMKLPPTVAEELGLYPGMTLDDDALQTLRETAGLASARQRAVRIISMTGVSKQDLEQRLRRKGETPDHARAAVDWLSELKLLDDAAAARQIVERGVSRGYGAERIRQMLYEKKIPRAYWDEALAAMPDMTDALTDFLHRRLGGAPDEKARRSAAQAALRRGYRWEEVRAAMERLNLDSEEATYE